MKDHEIAKIINTLRDTAEHYHNYRSLRQMLRRIVWPLVEENKRLEEALRECIGWADVPPEVLKQAKEALKE